MSSAVSRRSVLKAPGVAVSLPLLESLRPRVLASEDAHQQRKRIVLISLPLGLHAPNFFPSEPGRDYKSSPYLAELDHVRREFSVFSGMSHHYGGGHGTRSGLFTGVAPSRMRHKKIRNSISLDQFVARKMHTPCRYASLIWAKGGTSVDERGVKLPSVSAASQAFNDMFVEGSEKEKRQQLARLAQGASVLDSLREQAKELNRSVSAGDRRRLNQLMESIRDAERSLQRDRQWIHTPKPTVEADPIEDNHGGTEIIQRQRQWYHLASLALQTDVSRVISLCFHSHASVTVDGQTFGHHDVSHHGKREAHLKKLALVERAEMKAFGEFLQTLKEVDETGLPLLDQTQVLMASDLGNASAHHTNNLPIILAGGDYQHAGHVRYDLQNNRLMSDLFVRMLHQMDLPVERFGNSAGCVSEI